MTIDELVATDWAKDFESSCSTDYEEALRIATNPEFKVLVEFSTESSVPAESWPICAVIDGKVTDFWMDAKPTKAAALALCAEMGWPVLEQAQ